MTDTTPAAATVQANVQRRLTGVERLRIAFDMSRLARALAEARLRQDYSTWSDADVAKELLCAAFAPEELPRMWRESPTC